MRKHKIPLIIALSVFFVNFVTLTALTAAGTALANELFEVTVKARGANQEEALSSAIDEAVRRSVGTLFAENTQLEGDIPEEKLISFSRGTAANYKILESSSDDSGVALTVLVTVDFTQLAENARTIKDGTAAGGMEYRKTPLLDRGQKILADFLRGLKYENFLEVGLENQQIDVRKGTLSATVFMKINRGRYISEFAEPMAKAMGEIFASPNLREEAEGEYENSSDRFAAFFHVLGENYSSGGWALPRSIYETLKRDARFWDAGKGRIQTHKRIWLHFSLRDGQGNEIERLPVHLLASNVLFFSEERKEPTAPQFFMGMAESGLRNSFTLAAAPYFGATARGGYEFYESFSQSFAFKLPEELLRQVSGVSVALELER